MAAAIVVIMVGVPMWRLKQEQSDMANQDEVCWSRSLPGLSRSVAQPCNHDQTLDHGRQYRTGRVPMKRRSQLWGVLFPGCRGGAGATAPRRERRSTSSRHRRLREEQSTILGWTPVSGGITGEMAEVKLSSDQQRKMDEVFQQSRLRLIDVNAALQRGGGAP